VYLFSTYFCVTLSFFLLGGCAALPPAGANADAVRARLGAPAYVAQLPSGERWFYPSGPLGETTLAVDFNQGRVTIMTPNVLTEERITSISAGLTSEQVLATIGPPHMRVRFERLRETAWDYRYRDTWGYPVKLAVMIGDDGLVARRVAERVEKADGGPDR
jgi:outer membrane protein assembly factor BamE (lipoprotein component of BamABCDE complex)